MAVYVLGLSLFEASGAMPFMIYYAVVILISALRGIRCFRDRRFSAGLIIFGLALILAQGVVWRGLYFKGRADIGEGEAFQGYSVEAAGPWARPVKLPVSSVKLRKDRPESCTLTVDGMEKELVKGAAFDLKGMGLKLTGIYTAPLFILQNNRGMELEAGYIKLALEDNEDDYFQFRIIPHRFYVSSPGLRKKVWKKEDSGWMLAMSDHDRKTEASPHDPGDRLNLKIVRGKLTLYSGEIRAGHAVAFDGHSVRLEHGAPWISLEAENTVGLHLLYPGLAMILTGGIVGLSRRAG